MLGSLFTPQVPLGPTRDIIITCYVSGTGKGKLHGSPECRTLRSAASVNRIDVPFGEAVERLCASCRWPLPASGPILPFSAAVSEVDSLVIWLDRGSEDEEDLEAERDAAIALTVGEYPPSATDSSNDEEEDDETGSDEEWERYDRARNIRSQLHAHWRRLHSYLARSNEAVAEYPFLAPWADGLQSRLATVLEEERRAFTALVQPVRLLEAAAVRLLPTPKFSDDPGFAGLGAKAEKTFRRAWYEWSRRAIWSWHRLEDQASWSGPSSATPLGVAVKGSPRPTPPSAGSPPTGSARHAKKPAAPSVRHGS
jgi:hypothetical protein